MKTNKIGQLRGNGTKTLANTTVPFARLHTRHFIMLFFKGEKIFNTLMLLANTRDFTVIIISV